MAEEAINGGTLGDGADDHLNQKRPNLEDIDDENVLHSMVKYLNACTVPLATTRVGEKVGHVLYTNYWLYLPVGQVEAI